MQITLNQPNNQTQEVLYELIMHDKINRREMFISTGILNLTARISDLRNKHDIGILCTEIEVINKFGRKVSYGEWSLINRDYAIIMYNNLKLKDIR